MIVLIQMKKTEGVKIIEGYCSHLTQCLEARCPAAK